ncbi:proline iminopeptidase-family hydrolase [Leucobacter sp. BZR 635]
MKQESTIETGLAPTQHGSLWYQVTRPPSPAPDAIPVVLLHGGPGSPSDYLAPLDALSDERSVIRYDQIGCGRSDAATDGTAWTVEAHVDHLARLLRELGIEKAHIYGHSWGGMLALAFHEAHPAIAASLILASPLVSVDQWIADANELVALLPEADREAIAAGASHEGYAVAEAEFYRRHFCRIEPWPAPILASNSGQNADAYNTMWGPNEFTQTGNLKGHDRSGSIAGLQVPNLWLTGADDEARPATVRRFASMSKLSTVNVFPEGTHSVHLEQPDAYLTALRDFLRNV